VCLSSCFSGIFEKTGLLNQIDSQLSKLSGRISKEATFLITSILTSMIACNQSLATILTNDLSKSYQPDRYKRAVWMENTVIVIAPLIPWNIAGAVPLAILGVSSKALLFASYLYLLPAFLLISGIIHNVKEKSNK
jgi:NhaC family Na+:H+ antiporter